MEELFFSACEEGATNVVAKYIRKKLNVNCRDPAGSTGLMKACLNGHYDLVKLLLESNADPHMLDFYGHNALHYASLSNDERLCKLICGTKVNASQTTRNTQMLARDYALKAVSFDVYASPKFVDAPYLTEAKQMKRWEASQNNFLLDKDEPRTSEERMFNLLLRYENLALSEAESSEEEVKGEVYKKAKKKLTKKKSGKKSGKGKKGVGKKKKK